MEGSSAQTATSKSRKLNGQENEIQQPKTSTAIFCIQATNANALIEINCLGLAQINASKPD